MFSPSARRDRNVYIFLMKLATMNNWLLWFCHWKVLISQFLYKVHPGMPVQLLKTDSNTQKQYQSPWKCEFSFSCSPSIFFSAENVFLVNRKKLKEEKRKRKKSCSQYSKNTHYFVILSPSLSHRLSCNPDESDLVFYDRLKHRLQIELFLKSPESVFIWNNSINSLAWQIHHQKTYN